MKMKTHYMHNEKKTKFHDPEVGENKCARV